MGAVCGAAPPFGDGAGGFGARFAAQRFFQTPGVPVARVDISFIYSYVVGKALAQRSQICTLRLSGSQV